MIAREDFHFHSTYASNKDLWHAMSFGDLDLVFKVTGLFSVTQLQWDRHPTHMFHLIYVQKASLSFAEWATECEASIFIMCRLFVWENFHNVWIMLVRPEIMSYYMSLTCFIKDLLIVQSSGFSRCKILYALFLRCEYKHVCFAHMQIVLLDTFFTYPCYNTSTYRLLILSD